MKYSKPLISEHNITEGAKLYSSSLGNILVGCPPEILKALMVKHIPMPDTIVIPGTLYRHHSSQACLEFPFYHFLFIQQGLARGKKFKVYAKKSVCKTLTELARITLLGPDLKESIDAEKRLGIPKKLDKGKIKQILKEVDYLAPKNEKGKNYKLNEMIEFIPLEIGNEKEVYPAYKEHPAVKIKREDENKFSIACDIKLKCDVAFKRRQSPVYPINPKPISDSERQSQSIFTVRCLGSSEGFDPTKPANGFLFHFHGKWFLWDCPAYLRLHLDKLGLGFDDIDGIFISHVHEDHLDIMETISDQKKVKIYTSPEIFHCMILKLMAILECSYDEAKAYYDFYPIYVNQPFELDGADIEVFYSSHAIPALGLRMTVNNQSRQASVFISGDNLSKRMIKKLTELKIYDKNRLDEVNHFLPDKKIVDIAFVDTGGGAIHADVEDYAKNKNKIVYMHTGKKLKGFPKHHLLLSPGQRFTLIK